MRHIEEQNAGWRTEIDSPAGSRKLSQDVALVIYYCKVLMRDGFLGVFY